MGRLTESQFLPRVRGQREPEERHGGDEDAGDDQVKEVVEGATPKINQDQFHTLMSHRN